jgi:Flp pilus assembly protein TadD
MSPQTPIAPIAVVSRPRTGRPSRGGRFLGLAYWLLVLGLIGLNARWVWDDLSTEDSKTIDAWLKAGRVADAEQALRHQLKRSPYEGEARMKLARLLAKRGEYKACAEQLHLVPYWSPKKPEALFLEGQTFKLADRVRDAEAAWKGCIADDPLHPMPPRYFHGAARDLVAYYILEGRLDEAEEVIWRAYADATPAERRGILLMRLRSELERIAHEEAVTKLARYVSVTPDDWEARRALALEEQWTGQDAAADRDIKACLKARPADPGVWRTRLEILHRRGDLDGMRAALTQLPLSANEDAPVCNYRGLALEQAGDLEGACEAFRRAVSLKPSEASYAYKLGLMEQRLGHADQARYYIRQSQRLAQAYQEMHVAFFDYIQTTQRAKPGDAEDRAAVERLASLCDQLGWNREADAWRHALSEG